MTNSEQNLAALYGAHLDSLSQRLDTALAAAGVDGLAVFAGDLEYAGRDDVPYPYRVEPHFARWLPLADAPGSVLLLGAGGQRRLLYRQEDDFWHVPAADPNGYWTDYFDILIVRSGAQLCTALGQLNGRWTAFGAPAALADSFDSVDDPRVLAELDYYRALKTPYEIGCMQRASGIAAEGHVAARRAFIEGASEFELHQAFCAATRQREAELPYDNIVALNEHGAILHYQLLDRLPPPVRRSFLIDAGARALGYAADVTRTWSGASSEFAALIESMDRLQQTLCSEVRAGVDFVALNDRAHRLLDELLVEHGIVLCGAEEAYATGITRAFLPHGLGHLLGLQVHDVGGRQATPDGDTRPAPPEHPYLRLTRTLAAGFALTIEPGIYFIGSLLERLRAERAGTIAWDAVAALQPFGGVRIEDNVVVESSGCRNLTRDAFAALEQQEPLDRSGSENKY